MAAPLAALRDELFTTLRARPSIVSLAEYEADRDSLARMLVAFESDRGAPAQALDSLETSDAQLVQVPVVAAGGEGGGPASTRVAPEHRESTTGHGEERTPGQRAPEIAARFPSARLLVSRAGWTATQPASPAPLAEQGMNTMMRTYERELRSPVRNLVTGDLARCLLIQVSLPARLLACLLAGGDGTCRVPPGLGSWPAATARACPPTGQGVERCPLASSLQFFF